MASVDLFEHGLLRQNSSSKTPVPKLQHRLLIGGGQPEQHFKPFPCHVLLMMLLYSDDIIASSIFPFKRTNQNAPTAHSFLELKTSQIKSIFRFTIIPRISLYTYIMPRKRLRHLNLVVPITTSLPGRASRRPPS
jgi:hypothetical protein